MQKAVTMREQTTCYACGVIWQKRRFKLSTRNKIEEAAERIPFSGSTKKQAMHALFSLVKV